MIIEHIVTSRLSQSQSRRRLVPAAPQGVAPLLLVATSSVTGFVPVNNWISPLQPNLISLSSWLTRPSLDVGVEGGGGEGEEDGQQATCTPYNQAAMRQALPATECPLLTSTSQVSRTAGGCGLEHQEAHLHLRTINRL